MKKRDINHVDYKGFRLQKQIKAPGPNGETMYRQFLIDQHVVEAKGSSGKTRFNDHTIQLSVDNTLRFGIVNKVYIPAASRTPMLDVTLIEPNGSLQSGSPQAVCIEAFKFQCMALRREDNRLYAPCPLMQFHSITL